MTKIIAIALTYLLVLFSLNGCGSSDNKASEGPSPNIKAELAQRKTTPYLSYEYNLSIQIEKSGITEKYKALTTYCTSDSEHNCTILESNLSIGNYSYGKITIRISPKGVQPLLTLASSGGQTTSESIKVEDLSAQVFDTQKRIKLLQSYQADLLELQQQAKGNIDSLIKVSQEIANTQSQLEELTGNNEILMQRVNMNIINIHLSSLNENSFLQPIVDSLDEFMSNLAEGTAVAITGVAYLLPWFIVLILLFFIIKFFWRKLR